MVRIITDSASDFEPAELKVLRIACIPLRVMFGQQEYEENLDLSKERFYLLQASSGIYQNLMMQAINLNLEDPDGQIRHVPICDDPHTDSPGCNGHACDPLRRRRLPR